VYGLVLALDDPSNTLVLFLPIFSMIVLLIMVTHLIAAVFDLKLGIETAFIFESNGAVQTAVAGRPSIPTMGNFMAIACLGILAVMNFPYMHLLRLCIGWVVSGTGCLAVIGYLVTMPVLYYYVPGVNTAMAMHTAILFVLLGVSLILLRARKE
jgi:hypothetical protein